ncbi:MAG: hypothetical protein Kow00114_22500 [Kiloniellaceae bacterium]
MNKQRDSRSPKPGDKNVESFGLPGVITEMPERIRYAITCAGGDQAVSDRSGVKVRSIQNYKSGGATPNAQAIGKIAKATGFNLDWLVFGEGPMRPGGAGMAEAGAPYAAEGEAVGDPYALAFIAATVIGYCRRMETPPRLDDQARVIVDCYDKALREGGRDAVAPGMIIELLEELGGLSAKQRS